MNIQQLFNDYSIPFVTEGHKHCQPGWVNLECPFCVGNPGYHLGWNESEQYFHCWRCGGKFPDQVISKLLNISTKKAEQIIRDYGGVKKQRIKQQDDPVVKIRLKKFKYPSPLIPLQLQHIKYLEKRNFDAEKLSLQWNLMGTTPMSLLDGINYSHRILAPISWKGEVVSFQTRDITNKHPKKYLACPKEREIIHHKHILYGTYFPHQNGICVEGITDVWRMGKQSFAVFGIEYTLQQVREIANRCTRVAVMFDGGEEQATRKANQLVADLKFRGVDAFRVDIIGDPAEMSQMEADYLVKQIT